MTSDDLIKLLGQSGVIGVLLFILGRITWRVAERMIAAIDRLSTKIDEHKDADASIQQEIAFLRGRIEAHFELTPVESPPQRKTPAKGVPLSYYGPRRPGTRSDE